MRIVRIALRNILVGLFCTFAVQSLFAQKTSMTLKDGKISYNVDQQNNRVLDFSYCGYRSSEKDIPEVPNKIVVSSQEGDCSSVIQRAINYVSSLAPDKNGFRGAVLLGKGVFHLDKSLFISKSGVVLRGADKNQTILVKRGSDRGAVVYVEGKNDFSVTDTLSVTSSYIPVNSRTITVASAAKLKKGDRVMIYRPSTTKWIESLGCEHFGGGITALGWKAGDIEIYWDRTISSLNNGNVELDVPLTMAVDAQQGKAQVLLYHWNGRISDSGVENISFESEYNKKYPKDEDHCWTGVSIENAENCWVRHASFRYFAGSAVFVQRTASKVTVEDCISTNPVSEIGGLRRNTFLTMGQQTLFQRCYSEHGIHDFGAGYCAPGPNAFVQCESKESFGFSGAIDSWACGLLFDVVNVDGNNLSFKNMGQDFNGAGWGTSNSLFWQCSAAEIECYSPAKDAMNRAYGCWAQFSGDGEWNESNNHIQPRSIFYSQLAERLGKDCSQRARILPVSTEASSSPTLAVAAEMAKQAYTPKLTLRHWIEQDTLLVSVDQNKLKLVSSLKVEKEKAPSMKTMSVEDGRIVINNQLLTGNRSEVPWWSGKLRTNYLEKAKPHITRFVPGREGLGLTDRIDSVVNFMKNEKITVLDHNYGLWYDRRRDDHERTRRRTGDVWGPFYEQPFGRSGESSAWEGLSKYDLTRPNAWYWGRLKEFATQSDKEGLVLFHENYFQHNILEAGAHWVDCPWRSANNINDTDFPEPVPFTGDKRIFMADRFYDISHPVRRELHKKYIRQCLNNFADNKNVVQLISAEFTGPLHFVEFWLDEIGAWEKETGKHATVALSTTKDVQDAILKDKKRSALVDIIDIRYWHYKSDGTTYAPEGGKNLAPRQHARQMKVGKVTFNEAYKAVSEYREKYPEKAVTFYAQNYPDMAWAVFMAGGSLPVLPEINDPSFLNDAAKMHVEKTGTDGYYKLEKNGLGVIVYSQSKENFALPLAAGTYSLKQIDQKSGKVTTLVKKLKGGDSYQFKGNSNGPSVYWFKAL
nr:DUF6298 domain-containing protein [uncultured Bacteroides sp.]